MFNNGIIPEKLPERIFSMLKYIEKEDILIEDIKEKYQSKALNSDTGYFNQCLKACEELNLIEKKDGNILHFTGDASILANFESFRLFCNSVIWKDPDSSFFKLANGMLMMNDEVLKYSSITGVQFMQKIKSYCNTIDDKTMRGSRFWLSFLGLGNIFEKGNDIVFLPNSFIYLKDMLKLCGLRLNVETAFKDFIDSVNELSKISFFSNKSNSLNLGMSLAMRTLHDMGIIELKYNLDSEIKYYLYKSESHGFGNTFTHFVVKKGI